jgi:glyoxylase-like metal-dependent hydrolase (beta-lactamase superfamily II)
VPLQRERFDDVLRLRMHNAASRAVGLHVSAYVIRGVLIDTGFHRVRHELLAALEGIALRGAMVTHWHEDHAGNVELLAGRGIPIQMRGDTAERLRTRPDIRLYRRVVWGHPPALSSMVTAFDGEGLLGIHTPGHSADHQVIWDPRTGTLFSGDLWLGVRARVLHATEDPYQLVESLRTALALEPARMFDAHRGEVREPVRAIRDKIAWLTDTLGTIEARVRDGWSDRAIVRRMLGGEELAAALSRGEYARRNLVRAVRRHVSR